MGKGENGMLSTSTCGVLKVLSKKQLTLDHIL